MTELGWELTLIGTCLVFSGFFSSAETALVSLTMPQIEQLLVNRPRYSRPINLWKNRPQEVLTTILIGNNVVNITASALAADIAAQLLPGQSIAIAIGVMTFLILVSGEIFPKTVARVFSVNMAPPVLVLIGGFHLLLFPLSWPLTRSMQFLLRLGGTHTNHTKTTEEDVAFTIKLGGQNGVLPPEKRELLEAVLNFSDTNVREVMTPRTEIIALSIEDGYKQAMEICRNSGYSRLPITNASLDDIEGMFYVKSLLTKPNSTKDEKNFVRNRVVPPVYVPESQRISDVLKQFQKTRIHIAMVVDEFGGTSGLLTMEDIIEELLGEIRDEFDDEKEKMSQLSEGVFLADARISLGDVEEHLHIQFPEERAYESLGGFIVEEAGEVPVRAWECVYAGWRFYVHESNAQRVVTVRIEGAPKAIEQPAVPENLPENGTRSLPKESA